MPDLSEQIEQAAAGPKTVSVDGQTVTARSIDELIEADKHLGRKAAAGKSRLPIRTTKIRPDGAL